MNLGIEIVLMLVILINLVILALNIKLYTEFFKSISLSIKKKEE